MAALGTRAVLVFTTSAACFQAMSLKHQCSTLRAGLFREWKPWAGEQLHRRAFNMLEDVERRGNLIFEIDLKFAE